MKKRSNKGKKYVLDVTQEDYEAEIASGTAREDAMKPGKHVFRRVEPGRVAKPEDLERSNTKLIITARIDADIVDYFKKRAEEPGAPGYQTQMNDALRAVMERERSGDDFSRLLENERFITALAEKLRRRKPRQPA